MANVKSFRDTFVLRLWTDVGTSCDKNSLKVQFMATRLQFMTTYVSLCVDCLLKMFLAGLNSREMRYTTDTEEASTVEI